MKKRSLILTVLVLIATGLLFSGVVKVDLKGALAQTPRWALLKTDREGFNLRSTKFLNSYGRFGVETSSGDPFFALSSGRNGSAKGGFYAAQTSGGRPGLFTYAINQSNANLQTAFSLLPPQTTADVGGVMFQYSTNGGNTWQTLPVNQPSKPFQTYLGCGAANNGYGRCSYDIYAMLNLWQLNIPRTQVTLQSKSVVDWHNNGCGASNSTIGNKTSMGSTNTLATCIQGVWVENGILYFDLVASYGTISASITW